MPCCALALIHKFNRELEVLKKTLVLWHKLTQHFQWFISIISMLVICQFPDVTQTPKSKLLTLTLTWILTQLVECQSQPVGMQTLGYEGHCHGMAGTSPFFIYLFEIKFRDNTEQHMVINQVFPPMEWVSKKLKKKKKWKKRGKGGNSSVASTNCKLLTVNSSYINYTKIIDGHSFYLHQHLDIFSVACISCMELHIQWGTARCHSCLDMFASWNGSMSMFFIAVDPQGQHNSILQAVLYQ